MSAVQARPLTGEKLIVVPYRKVSASAVATNVVLILLGCFFLLPMLWMVFASIDSNPDWAIKIPSPTIANFTDVLGRADALSSFRSSLILAGTTTVVTTVLALLSAYPLSRMHIPFKRSFMLLILFASGLPVSMLVVPVYQMYVYLGWLDSLYTTALFLAASSLPFAIWLMKNFIDAVPEELEESAEIEGASSLRILLRIIIPLTIPGIGVTAIVTFRRDGTILGHPKITYESENATDNDRLEYRIAVMEALQRCTPMPFTESMGGAVAGRPFAVRFQVRKPPPKPIEKRAWLTPTTL